MCLASQGRHTDGRTGGRTRWRISEMPLFSWKTLEDILGRRAHLPENSLEDANPLNKINIIFLFVKQVYVFQAKTRAACTSSRSVFQRLPGKHGSFRLCLAARKHMDIPWRTWPPLIYFGGKRLHCQNITSPTMSCRPGLWCPTAQYAARLDDCMRDACGHRSETQCPWEATAAQRFKPRAHVTTRSESTYRKWRFVGLIQCWQDLQKGAKLAD